MRQVIFVGSPEGSSEESLAQMDEAIQKIREAADALRAALAEDRLADYLPPKRDEQAKGKGMTREEIIRMARAAGFSGLLPSEHVDGTGDVWAADENITGEMERFAHLVAAAEREACAKEAKEKWCFCASGDEIAQYLRERGQE